MFATAISVSVRGKSSSNLRLNAERIAAMSASDTGIPVIGIGKCSAIFLACRDLSASLTASPPDNRPESQPHVGAFRQANVPQVHSRGVRGAWGLGLSS